MTDWAIRSVTMANPDLDPDRAEGRRLARRLGERAEGRNRGGPGYWVELSDAEDEAIELACEEDELRRGAELAARLAERFDNR